MMRKSALGGVLALTLAFSLALLANLSAAQGPAAQSALGTGFTYQGRLTDAGGPVNGVCNFSFSLYDPAGTGSPPTGGTLLGTDTASDVPLEEGLFTVLLDFGPGVFAGEGRWLEIEVDCGAGPVTLERRQELTAAPYALHALAAGSVPWSGLTGVPPGFADGVDDDTTYTAGDGLTLAGTEFQADPDYLQRRVAETCAEGYAIRAIGTGGTVLCEPVSGGAGDITAVLAGAGLTGGGQSGPVTLTVLFGESGTADVAARADHEHADLDYWALTGNAGTMPASHYLGTSDDQALELRVNGERALRLEPNAGSPNLVGGHSVNGVSAGAVGGTIGGGGRTVGTVVYIPNRATDDYGTVSGGAGNYAGNADADPANSPYATVGGGNRNTAGGAYAAVGGGSWNEVEAAYATIAGGGPTDPGDAAATQNRVTDDYGTIGGGGNRVGSDDGDPSSATYATIGGGYTNVVSGSYATIGGGIGNTASSAYATVGGGEWNDSSAGWATVGAGFGNAASAYMATVGGGELNAASAFWSTVPGGFENEAAGRLSLAAGTRARALHDGSFVCADCGDQCDSHLSTLPFDSTGDNQFLVRAQGGVGLGTNSPGNQLHVREEIAGAAMPENHVAQIENGASENGGDVLALMVGQVEDPDAATNFVTFFMGGGNNPIGSIEGDGSGGVTLHSGGGDYAEWLPRLDPAEALAPGDVVGVHGGRVSRRTAGAGRVLVVSRAPIVLGNDPGQEEAGGYEKVAFLGQVEVKVRGPVQAGDWLLPSGREDGTAIALAPEQLAAEQFAQVLGQAWEASDGPGLKLVRAAVGYGPPAGGLAQQIEALEAENDALEARLAALEAGGGTATASRFQLPGGWLLLGGLVVTGSVALGRRRPGGGR